MYFLRFSKILLFYSYLYLDFYCQPPRSISVDIVNSAPVQRIMPSRFSLLASRSQCCTAPNSGFFCLYFVTLFYLTQRIMPSRFSLLASRSQCCTAPNSGFFLFILCYSFLIVTSEGSCSVWVSLRERVVSAELEVSVV